MVTLVERGHHQPYDIDIEAALLGATLVDNSVLARVSPLIGPEDFYDPLHARIFETMAKALDGGSLVWTPLTLHAAMKSDAGLIEVGGIRYLAGMAGAAPAMPNVRHYANILGDLAARRKLIALGQQIVNAAYLPPLGLTTVNQIVMADNALKDLARDCSIAHDQSGGCFTIADWLKRDIPPLDQLLGGLFHTTLRMMLVACTGLGKTNFVMALLFAMSDGRPFLHWGAGRPARCLFIDGEMSRRLMRIRLEDAARRHGSVPENLFVLCRDDLEGMPPLNTVEGQTFIDHKIEGFGGVDFVIFDNVQSLVVGDMKDEQPWQDTLPWIRKLSQRSIGQLWVHHTGHDKTRSYGTSTREWQLDTVVVLEGIERLGADISFTVSFTKARERAPHNRADFEPVVVTLMNDKWAVETPSTPIGKAVKKASPKALAFHAALIGALNASGKIRPQSINQPSVTLDEWSAECDRRGLTNRDGPPNQRSALLSKYRLELIAGGWVLCSGNIIWNRMVAS